jgi:hypothetical protein
MVEEANGSGALVAGELRGAGEQIAIAQRAQLRGEIGDDGNGIHSRTSWRNPTNDGRRRLLV